MYIHLNSNRKINEGEFFATQHIRRQCWLIQLIIMGILCKTGRRTQLFCKGHCATTIFKMYRHAILICLIFVPEVLMAPPPFGLFRPPHTRESGVAK
jgi:hypothetical protein